MVRRLGVDTGHALRYKPPIDALNGRSETRGGNGRTEARMRVLVAVLTVLTVCGIPALAITADALGEAGAEVGRAEWRAIDSAARLEAARLEADLERAGWKIER